MYIYTLLHNLTSFTNFLLTGFPAIPFLILVSFFFIISFYLYFSLKNIFKIFFLTEMLLLIVVLFLVQLSVIYPQAFTLNYFYCQLILAAAAAEAALFLGLFSHLYDQQFSNWIKQSNINTVKNIFF